VTNIAPDGSPVELYARLAPLGEPELIHAAVPAGATILELGCGAGRVTHPLVALDHPVVAVDNSEEMLARVSGAETVLADIETLDLGRRFPVVLLGSNFVNDPDPARRRRLLAACARHVEPGGLVLAERTPPDWEPSPETEVERGGVLMTLRELSRHGKLVSAVMEYRTEASVWRHAFTSYLIDDDELAVALAEAALRLDGFLDEQRAWIRAVPALPGRA
jgi:SAM-dependent methyltransferase